MRTSLLRCAEPLLTPLRTAALIPPSTLIQVVPQLPQYTDPPIRMRTFAASGLSVLHAPPYTRAAFAARLVGMLSLGASVRH